MTRRMQTWERSRVARHARVTAALSVVALLGAGCENDERARRDGVLRVVVSVPPMAEFVRRLAPEAEVHVLIRPGQSCHAFELRPSDVAAVRKADMVVLVGLGLEQQAQGVFDRHARGADVWTFADAVGLKDEHAGHDHAGHDHSDCEHTDSHLWLDAGLVMSALPSLAETIAKAAEAESLTGEGGGSAADAIASRRDALATEIKACDDEIARELEPIKGAAMVSHHDSFGRFAERYGLTVACVIRPIATSEPSPDQISGTLEAIKRENARAIFVEPQFSPEAAKRIAGLAGVRVGSLDPVGNEDWFALMRSVAGEISRTLSP